MPNTYLTVADLINAGIPERKAREAISIIHSKLRKSGGMFGSRDSAPRSELEALFHCALPIKGEGES